MRFVLGCVQLSLEENPELNYAKLVALINRASDGSLILLPEMFFCGFDYEKLEEASCLSDYVIERLKVISKEKELMLCGTAPKKTERGIKNTAFLIDRGKLVGQRSKIKLFSPFGEDKYFLAGKENPVFETRFGRIGILICFELRFTDMVLSLKKKGIDILLVPAQWGYSRREHLKILSRARAIELQCYVAVADTWKEFKGIRFAGMSAIYSPWGEVLAFSEEGDTLLEAFCDLKRVEEVRQTLPVELD